MRALGLTVPDTILAQATEMMSEYSLLLLLALFGHPSPPTGCPLSGVKRKSASASSTSESDRPKADISRTSALPEHQRGLLTSGVPRLGLLGYADATTRRR